MSNSPNLTPKQEMFCCAYLETGNASKAYRLAYDAAKMKPATVNRTAKELLDNPKIAARLAELRKPLEKQALMTVESHLARLDELGRQAEAAGWYSPAIAAEISRGKVMGYYVDRKEIRTGSLDDASDAELEARIEEMRAQIADLTEVPDAKHVH